MAAAGITQADRLPSVEDFDYSKSHRTVPIPTTSYTATSAGSPPKIGERPWRPRDQDEGSSVHTEGRRRGSFTSFLQRSKSHQKEPPLPPAPSTRIAQAHAQQQAAPTSNPTDGVSYHDPRIYQTQVSHDNHNRTFSFSSRKSSGEGGKMLRKSSKMRQQQEQERLAREAAAHQVPKHAPHLPSFNPLPNISTFGGEDARPDSVAIFNNQYTTDPHQAPLPRQPSGATANFSRPGAAMPSSNFNSSSSPSYAIRQGNAFAQAQAAASSSPSVTGRSTNGEYASDPATRAESMTNRGRYSYASSTAQVNVNSPRRVRRRKDPTPFNALVIGAKNSGKSSFISFLRHSLALPSSKQQPYTSDARSDGPSHPSKSSFTSHYLESELDGERIGVTLWDSAGLEKHIIDLQLREMAAFVESKFEETFVEEQKVMRSPGVKDTHIHCVFLVLDPVRLDSTIAASAAFQKGGNALANASGLDDDLDLQVMRALWGKTTVIPVISKADTLTLGHMSFLKRAVWDSLKDAKLDPLEALELEGDDEDVLDEDDEDETDGHQERDLVDGSDEEDDESGPLPRSKKNGHARQTSLAATVSSSNGDELPYLPMSILSPDPYDLPPYAKVSKNSAVGRRFPWGMADPHNPDHCDFTRLRDSIFSEWRGDLRDLARTKWYENWRTSRLKNLPGSKQRIKGGVTPVAAVPKEGRMSPKSIRTFSGSNQAGNGAAAASVPRSVSGSTAMTGGNGSSIGVAVSVPSGTVTSHGMHGASKAERMMGMSVSDAQSVASGRNTYRGVESYQ